MTKTSANAIPDTGHTSGTQSDAVGAGLWVEGSAITIGTENDKLRPGRKRKDGAVPSKMRVTDSKTPRSVLSIIFHNFSVIDIPLILSNLCARAWKEQHPNGLTDAYEKYWNQLNDADRKVYQHYIILQNCLLHLCSRYGLTRV